MTFQRVVLESIGYALPAQVVTSQSLEQRLASVYERFCLHAGRLEMMTGIRERRFWEPGTRPSDGATLAGRAALQAAGLRPDQIDCLLFTAVSRDFLEPASASVVHHNLALPASAQFFDVSNACLGFLNGLVCVANMIELGQVRRGLVVAGESGRQLVETTIDHLLSAPDLTRRQLKDAFASLTIGSGAAAMVLAHESVATTSHRLLGGAVRTATQHNDLCRGSADTGFHEQATMLMTTDSETLLVHGCELAVPTWQALKQALGWRDGDVDRVYTHQVGVTHRERLFEVLAIDPAKDFHTVEFLGNVGSVSLPVTMALGIEAKPPRPGERIALLGIGSGLSSMMLGLQW